MSLSASQVYGMGCALLGAGTYAFMQTEKLDPIDAFYLSGMTFTTIGYGDIQHPSTRNGKLAMMILSLFSIGYFGNVLLPYLGQLRERLDTMFGSTGLISAVLLLVINGLVGGAMCHLLEDPGLPKVSNPFDVMYWTFVTGTSVGYGDFAPKTSNGKIATVFYALFAVQSAGNAWSLAGEWLKETFLSSRNTVDDTKKNK